MAGRARLRRWPRFALEDVHRFGGLLVGSFIAIHVVTIAIDAYLPFSLPAHCDPVRRDLSAAVHGARDRRRRAAARARDHEPLPRPTAVHVLAPRALPQPRRSGAQRPLHGLGSGTDRSTPWLLALFAASVATVLAAGVWRVLAAHRRSGPGGAPAVAVAVAGVVMVVFAATGPLRFSPKPWNASAFQAPMAGKVVARRRGDPGARLGHGDRPRRAAGDHPRRSADRARPARGHLVSARVPSERPGLQGPGDKRAARSASMPAAERWTARRRFVNANWHLLAGETFQGRLVVHA